MVTQNTSNTSVPIYKQVRDSLEEMIETGLLRSGGLVPGERELAEKFGAARGTIRQAVNCLVREGLLVRLGRKGTIVSPATHSRNRTDTWGVVVPILHYFYQMLLTYIEIDARNQGVGIHLACSYDDVDLEREHVWRMIEAGVKGILIAPAWPGKRTHESLEYFADLPVPVVIVDHWGADLPLAGVDCVLSDKFSGAYQATVHMIRHGYTKIVLINGSQKATSYEIRELTKGYAKAMEDHDLPLPPLPDISQSEIRRDQKNVIAHLDWGAEAFVIPSDTSACSAINALHSLGKRVPDDVAVIGYDDEPIAKIISPMLSTVRVDKREISRRATELLAERIQNGHGGRSRSIVIRPTVVARETCARNCPEYNRNEVSEIEYLRETAGLQKIEKK
ncbi:MAG: GntR family transcriptional regulator [Phycisphaerae bacterium]|nr:GntR family transcriptional regulator [Phycisphaerae bacterium]